MNLPTRIPNMNRNPTEETPRDCAIPSMGMNSNPYFPPTT